MTPAIWTFTGNLLAEHTLEYAQWAPGKTQRARSQSFQVGGKGINVTKMLIRLGAKTRALAFAGGPPGQECAEWLSLHNLPCDLIATTRPTRSGVVIRSEHQPETTFLGPDVAPDSTAWSTAAQKVSTLADGVVLALCGSFPGWTEPTADALRREVARFGQRGILVADTYGPALAWVVTEPFRLVKINRTEFDGLFAEEERASSIELRLRSALSRWPVEAWVISDGEHPVWFASGEESPKSIPPPSIKEVSPTGSGDVLFACILHALYQRHVPLHQALMYALPFAAANAASPGVADFDLNNLPDARSLVP